MEASPVPRHHLLPPPVDDVIKQKLINNGVPNPSPKTIHTIRKKQTQKYIRKRSKNPPQTLISLAEEREAAEEEHFRALKLEYKSLFGKPWEGLDRVKMREMVTITDSKGCRGDSLKREHLRELGEFLGRERERFKWLLVDDVEVEEGWMGREKQNWVRPQRRGDDDRVIQFLVVKLSSTELNVKDWKFSRMMRQSKLPFTEGQLLKIVGGLGDKGQWKHALSVVEWVYSSKEHRLYKSRFVYTKLLAVLGKAQRPHEALKVFNVMRDDANIYPDMPAYHSIAVTLGQAGYLKELIKIIETMSKKPSKRIKNMRCKNWDPALQPDIVVFNAVLNACVSSHQWKGVFWVFQQLRKHGLKPNGPTFGLAMEVMLQSGKYDLVHEFFGKMKRSGEAPKALTYKVLVRSFWEEGKVEEAIEAVRDMEQRGVVGVASVYYELACCLCNKGRWQEAMTEIMKLKNLTLSKPLQVTFTGMILSSLDGGHVHDCISIFLQSKDHCAVDVGLINAMLKVYGSNDMFSEAKELFEEVKGSKFDSNKSINGFGSALSLDAYTFTMMLKASASAHQWEYFEFVYKEMILSGYMIDRSKDVTLLVKASRAGKWHLLEHAFDTVLEAGEIPHLSFFTELICQAIIHGNFERVTSLTSALAHAPWQISEKQWFDLFEKNGDRISKENLKELSEILGNCKLPTEATVSNLKRSLVSYCRYGCYKEVVNVDQLPSTGNSGNLSSEENVHTNNSFVNSLGTNPCDYLHHDSEIDVLDVAYSNSNDEDDAGPTILETFNHSCSAPTKGAKKCTALEDLSFGKTDDNNDDEFSESFECMDTDDEDMENDMQIGICGSTDQTNQPSASEILESWKQSREKNGTLLNF